MWFEWVMDDEPWKADVEPLLRFSHYLLQHLPTIRYHHGGPLVLLENRIVDTDLLPMFLLGGKTVQTAEGFSRSPTAMALTRRFEEAYGPPCPVCFVTRLFLGYHALEVVTQNRTQKLQNILSWVPCYCRQDLELLEFLMNQLERRQV